METKLPEIYRLVSELFVHPKRRDRQRIDRLWPALEEGPSAVRIPVESFDSSEAAWSADEYVQTLELAPPCPLYLGAYLFDEPGTCRGAGVSDRNGYLVELTNMYRHFGLELTGGELPDFVPIALEFLALTVEVDDQKDASLRRYFIDEKFRPALEPFREQLDDYESVYANLVGALETLIAIDWRTMTDAPVWRPPTDEAEPPTMSCSERLCSGPADGGSLPCAPPSDQTATANPNS